MVTGAASRELSAHILNLQQETGGSFQMAHVRSASKATLGVSFYQPRQSLRRVILPPCDSRTALPNTPHCDFFTSGTTSKQSGSIYPAPFSEPLSLPENMQNEDKLLSFSEARYVRKQLHCGSVRRGNPSKVPKWPPGGLTKSDKEVWDPEEFPRCSKW